MDDTQWPRYQVFLQEKAGAPHQDAGSVHAPDQEMALLNARDVFVRRPECANLWVVPVWGIFSRTAQELQRQDLDSIGDKPPKSLPETYYVFSKAKSAGTQTLVGTLEAVSPEQAMRKAVEEFSGMQPPYAWWVFPARLVLQNDPGDADSMFTPALDKTFRMATDFHTHTAMRQILEVEGKNVKS